MQKIQPTSQQRYRKTGPRMVLRPRTKNKLKRNIAIGGSALLISFALVFAYFNFGKTDNTQAAQIRNSVSGNWSSASTWSVGRVPASNDTVTIWAGKTVTVTEMTPEYQNMKIIVYGTLHFNGGKKLYMCNAMIDVMSGGLIEADNPGSMIEICGNTVWNGSMPGSGPLQIVNSPLPVELTWFKAESADNGTVDISWETASEINNDYFSVERSLNGHDFESMTKISGAGNSTAVLQYSYVDDNPHSPVTYYRLKQVDFDGKSETFKVVSVSMKTESEMTVYPNPVARGESAAVQVPAVKETVMQVFVTDAQGKQIFSQLLTKENSSDNMIHFTTEKFPAAGTYFVVASGQSNKYLKKIVVL